MADNTENPYQFDTPQPASNFDPQTVAIAQKYGISPDQMQSTAVTPTHQDKMDAGTSLAQPYNVPQLTAPITQQQPQQPFLSQYPFHQYLQDRHDAYQKGVGDKVQAPWDMSANDLRKAVDDYAEGPVRGLVTQHIYSNPHKLPAGQTAKEAIDSMVDAYKQQLHRELPSNLETLQNHFKSLRPAEAQQSVNTGLGETVDNIVNATLPQGSGPAYTEQDTPLDRAIARARNTAELGSNILQKKIAGSPLLKATAGVISPSLALDATPEVRDQVINALQNQRPALESASGATPLERLQDLAASVPAALAEVPVLNAPQAAVEIADKEKELGHPLSPEEQAVVYGANALLSRLPASLKGNVLKRVLSGGGIGLAGNTAVNAALGNDLTQGALPAALTGAVTGGVLGEKGGIPAKTPAGENSTQTAAASVSNPQAVSEGANATPANPIAANPATAANDAAVRAASFISSQRERLKQQQNIEPNTQTEYQFDAETSRLTSEAGKKAREEALANATTPNPVPTPLNIDDVQAQVLGSDLHDIPGEGKTAQEKWDSPPVQKEVGNVLNRLGKLSPEDAQKAVDTVKKLWAETHDVNPDEVVTKAPTHTETAPTSAEDALAAAATGETPNVATKPAETPQPPADPIAGLLASKQETQRTAPSGKAAKGRLPIEFVNPDDKLAYLFKQMGTDAEARAAIEQELIRRGYSTEQIPEYANTVSKRVIEASKDPLRSHIIISSGAPAKGAANSLAKKGRGAVEVPRNDNVLYSRKAPDDLSKLVPPDKVASEPIFAKDGTHENPNRAYTGNRIKPRHAVDETLMKLRTFDRDNPTRSAKMKWLMREAFPGETPDDIYNKSKELYRATTAEARDNTELTSRHKVDLNKATQRRPVDFRGKDNEEAGSNGIPKGLPGGKTPATVLLSKLMGGTHDIEAVNRDALPAPIRAAFEAFEKVTKTRIEIVRGKNGTELPFNGATLRRGTLYLNEASESPLVHVAGHEWTHQLEIDNPEMYKALEAEVKRQGYLDDYKARLAKRGDTTSLPERELTADAVGDAMGDPDFLAKLAQKNPTTFREIALRFWQYLKNLTGKMRDATLGSEKFLPELDKFRDLLASHLEKYTGPEGSEKIPRPLPGATEPLFSKHEDVVAAMKAKKAAAAAKTSIKPYVEPAKTLVPGGRTKAPEPSTTGKVIEFIKDVNRAMKLSSLYVFPKLSAAAAYRMIGSPIEQAIVSGLRNIPAIDRIAQGAPRYSGFNAKAELAAAKATFSTDTLKQMWRAFTKGDIDIDKYRDFTGEMGKSGENEIAHEGKLDRPILDFWTRAHAALKTPVKINEFTRSHAMRTQFEATRLVAEGKSPAEAARIVKSPEMQMEIGIKSYTDAQRSILLGNNKLYSAIEEMLRKGKTSDNLLAQGLAHTTELLAPIRKVPLNIAAEASEHAFGLANAMGVMRKGVEHMTPEEKDYVLRNLSKNTVGAALAALALTGIIRGGGYYTKDKRDYTKGQPHPGEIKTPLGTIPHIFTHAPPLEIIQMLGDYAKYMDRKNSPVQSTAKTANDFAKANVPLYDAMTRFYEGVAGDKYQQQQYVNNLIKGFAIPGAVSSVADIKDRLSNPGVTGRKTTNLTETLQSGIPGAREKLPPYRD